MSKIRFNSVNVQEFSLLQNNWVLLHVGLWQVCQCISCLTRHKNVDFLSEKLGYLYSLRTILSTHYFDLSLRDGIPFHLSSFYLRKTNSDFFVILGKPFQKSCITISWSSYFCRNASFLNVAIFSCNGTFNLLPK